MSVTKHLDRCWQNGMGIDQTIKAVARREGVRLKFHDVQAVFARLAAQWSGL